MVPGIRTVQRHQEARHHPRGGFGGGQHGFLVVIFKSKEEVCGGMGRGRRHVCRQAPIYKSSPRLLCVSPGDDARGCMPAAASARVGGCGISEEVELRLRFGARPLDECRAGALSEVMPVARLFYFCLWPADGKHRVEYQRDGAIDRDANKTNFRGYKERSFGTLKRTSSGADALSIASEGRPKPQPSARRGPSSFMPPSPSPLRGRLAEA